MVTSAETEIRVRFSDTDADGGVYFANYLTFFSAGRHDLLRQAGIDLNRLAREDDLRLVTVEATCRYHAMSYFDDLLVVRSRVDRLSNRAVIIGYEIIRRDGETQTLIATGTIVQVFIDRQNKSVPIPDWIREALS